MKKIISVLLVFFCLLTLASCNKKNPDNNPDTNPDNNPGSQQLPTEDNKIHLIVLAGQSSSLSASIPPLVFLGK